MNDSDDLRAFAKLASIVFVIWIVYIVLVRSVADPTPWELGDSLGALNTLFSGLALAAVALALFKQSHAIQLQRDDLDLQRQDLQLTRDELTGQREALETQATTMARQVFDTNFFQLLALHHSIVGAMRPFRRTVDAGIDETTEGRACFELIYQRFREKRKHIGSMASYRAVYDEEYEHCLGHYFRNLYKVLKYVDESQVLPSGEKQSYSNLIRAQLSSTELVMLYYNCLGELGREKFKPLIERYGFLQQVPRDKLLRDDDQPEYEPGAFASSGELVQAAKAEGAEGG